MQISTLRDQVTKRALDFAWNSWAQMGVSADFGVEDDRAADPEALLVFTLEVARRDPRLFDEVLDWLRANERLVSVQRLRNLSRDERDRLHVDAALGWVSQFTKNPRFRTRAEPPAEDLLRLPSEPSRKSQRPDVTRPVNFAFRLRLAFGVANRAEILRCLLTNPAPDVNVQVVSRFVAYAPRNVGDGLDALVAAGLVSQVSGGSERRYSIDRDSWLMLLRLERFPAYRDWPQLLFAVREVVRWLDDPELGELSDSMRASAARDLIERIEPDLLHAGVPVLGKARPGAAYWPEFVDTVETALDKLYPALSPHR